MIPRPRDEHWLPIQGFKGLYEISDYGRVRSLDHTITTRRSVVRRVEGRILKSNNAEYRQVQLGRGNVVYIHVLVCIHFVGPKPSIKHEVNHRDADKHNNFYRNLEWVTRSEQSLHANRLGLHPGKTHPQTIRKIQAALTSDQTYTTIARTFDVARGTVRRIDQGLTR